MQDKVAVCVDILNIHAMFQLQGHGIKVKVTAAKSGYTQIYVRLGHSLIPLSNYFFVYI